MIGETVVFPVLDAGHVELKINNNLFSFAPEQLFKVAARKNPKRFFLFVSTLLGKHLAVSEAGGLLTGALLSGLLAREIGAGPGVNMEILAASIKAGSGGIGLYSEVRRSLRSVNCRPAIFIGFAETATALGHAVFDCYGGESVYYHSTREIITDAPILFNFEEEHSHATSHMVYSQDCHPFNEDWPVILIDDEITTGRTALNIISDMHNKYPRRDYYLVSILDMRSESDRRKFQETAERLGININCISLFEGEASGRLVDGLIQAESAVPVTQGRDANVFFDIIDISRFFIHLSLDKKSDSYKTNRRRYLKDTGRFGLNGMESERTFISAVEAGRYLAEYRQGGRTLCIGSGEFMFLPMLVAAAMGENIDYKSTTRSPIWTKSQGDYPIKNGFTFKNIFNQAEVNYLYNLSWGDYDDVFVFFEHSVDSSMVGELSLLIKQELQCPMHFIHF